MYAVASSKPIFFGFFSIFKSGGITKHLMTGHNANSEFCFSSTSLGSKEAFCSNSLNADVSVNFSSVKHVQIL